jgi:hypothetical protein
MTRARKPSPDRTFTTVTVTLRPEPVGYDRLGRDPSYRLKLGLKRLLRSFGLRNVGLMFNEKRSEKP